MQVLYSIGTGCRKYGRLETEDEQVVLLKTDGRASSTDGMKHPTLVAKKYMRTRVRWKEWHTGVEESWSN